MNERQSRPLSAVKMVRFVGRRISSHLSGFILKMAKGGQTKEQLLFHRWMPFGEVMSLAVPFQRSIRTAK